MATDGKYGAVLVVALLCSATVLTGWTQSASSPVIAPILAVTNDYGQAIALLSLEAYRAEFRYLRRVAHEIDLSGPARRMTGLQRDVPETQWPFMQFCYFGFACVNLARCDPEQRNEAVREAQWLIDALQRPRLTGFIAEHFGPPFGEGFSTPSVFVHGLFVNLLMRYREVSGDSRYDILAQRIASALSHAFAHSAQGVLPTYPNMWWLTDNLPALAALVKYDRLHDTSLGAVKERFLQSARAHYLDDNGLLASYIDPSARRPLQCARGVEISYALHFLDTLDPKFAQEQYALAKAKYFRNAFGFAAVREFPDGAKANVDVDSGEVFFGFGTAASGFSIAAAAVMHDEVMAEQLLKSSALFGVPVFKHGELRYAGMPPVGQSVVLFGKTELLKNQRTPTGPWK